MGRGRVVFFEHDIAAGFFEKDFDKMRAVRVVINDQDASLLFGQRSGDGVDLRLIEPINLRPRRILTDDVRSIDVKSVCPFDHLDYAGYFRVYPVSHRPEPHCMSVDLFSRNWQLQYRRSVAHNSCANLAFVALAAQTLPNKLRSTSHLWP